MSIRSALSIIVALWAVSSYGTRPAFAGSVLFVDAAATGANNGASWADAYTSLQAALIRVRAFGGVDSIWVAEGTYRPNPPGGDRAPFDLINGVSILGGFAGHETAASDRNPRVHITILNGDLNEDDGDEIGSSNCCFSRGDAGCDNKSCEIQVCSADPFCCDEDRGGSWDVTCVDRTICLCENLCSRLCDNSFHVVRAFNVGASAVLDGFVISGGAANGGSPSTSRGAGIYIQDASPTIVRCTFTGNGADAEGGAASMSGSPRFVNCTFLGNRSTNGGGAAVLSGNPAFTNCIFNANTASEGGGAVYSSGGNPTISDCTLSGNTARQGGGVRVVTTPRMAINNSILWENRDRDGTGEFSQISLGDAASRVLVSYSDVQGFPSGFTGPGNIALDPLFENAAGEDQMPGSLDDDFRLRPGSPCIDAGGNALIPLDLTDLDADGNTSEPLPVDHDGRTRVFDDPRSPNTGAGAPPLVDMGAFEVASDCNQNGTLDDQDVADQTSEDCNGNRIPDECEISVDTPAPGGPYFCRLDCDADCDHNGRPDACQPDGDSDGLTDACDHCPQTPSGVPVDALGCSLPGPCCFSMGEVCFDGLQDTACAAAHGTFLGYGRTCASDEDEDGVRGCRDRCPEDPHKSEPGVCGCGVSDADGDGDGAANCVDPCPIDNPDDSDGDGLCNSVDPCPFDETGDTDGDGVCDSLDPCPLDNPDDRDGDGICNSEDLCPDDPDKGKPGVCGCGVDEDDRDHDGVVDCQDECLLTPAGVPVDEVGCPALGACCFRVAGVCADGAREADCRLVGAIYQGNRTLCSEGCAEPGDLNFDGAVDWEDHPLFLDCLAGPLTAAGQGCELSDFDLNNRTDLRDVGGYQTAFTGSGP